MIEARFESMEGMFEELQEASAQQEVISDVPRWQKILKEINRLEPAILAWRQYKGLLSEIEQAKEMLADPDMKEMLKEELSDAKKRVEELEQELKILLS